tara:strand:- start:439 stop:1290 length:852 start_codon:yes stop_codon:yes gene_type:complete
MKMTKITNLIEIDWLIKNFNKENIKIIDSSWYLPTINRSPEKEFNNCHIKKAKYFDIDKISNPDSSLPHMVPEEKQFEKMISNLGLSSSDHIICYAIDGIGTAPRVWWMFKLFGHNHVSVLNGGLRDWINAKGPVEQTSINKQNKKGNFVSKFQKQYITNFDEIKKVSENNSALILDARSALRFSGKVEEPRKGLKKGHIPNSINLPHELLVDNGKMLDINKLKDIFNTKHFKHRKQIICTCGSGVSACTLGLALNLIGQNNWSIYDGSWSEWGSIKSTKVII